MIKARAIVDAIIEPVVGLGRFRVEVFGDEPHDFVRIYVINAADRDKAAREGLDRFVEEIAALIQEA